MREYVERILAPYFATKKDNLGLPQTQKSLWSIDVWAVHRSVEFRLYMRKDHPTVILDYVPGGCTGADQPCDVGIQRPLKLSLKRSYHEDIVELFLEKIQADEDLLFDEHIGVLRDRSVKWLWKAWKALDNEELIKKVTNLPRCNERQLT
ncbi:hypothetical protein BDZ89DRAFT_965569 [Hymenopellis radicata]|nr:hypothetical protein BDZ89DRAFT_965561 [Hymenopellis radicata]KAF9007692.1 hypothetical protein BDZ89DRAFT_965569 [Hymenopellis radicata]